MVTIDRTAAVWQWLREVEDPEIPVVSVVDLGIVRDVRRLMEGDGEAWEIVITPTYSGCPATDVISQAVIDRLHAAGLSRVRVRMQLSPAWTTDWLSPEAASRLRDYGIAPPGQRAAQSLVDISLITGRGRRFTHEEIDPGIRCPRCDAEQVQLVSRHGSTPCKALYRCTTCQEPFDYFKPH